MLNKNQYLQDAAEDILEILDGMSFEEISDVEDIIEDVIYTAKNDREEYFNFAAYIKRRYFGDRND